MVPAVADTDTSSTPGSRRTAVSTLAAHPAQSMPSTRYRVCVPPSAITKSLEPDQQTLHPIVTRGARVMAEKISIGEASRSCGVKVPTIRYYEQIGLVPAPPRTESNRRTFDPGDLRRLAFIRSARELG